MSGDRAFLRLWLGQAISVFGTGVTQMALPLTAVLVLGAHAADMGWLLAVESAPVLLVGMFAGLWVDRVRRKPLLIASDLGRAVLLGFIPLLAVLGHLRMEHLFLVAAATGTLTVVFDVAFRSFVPDLLGRERMLQANSRFATVEAVSEITTPGLTGALIQVIAAPLAILLDAISFVASATCILSIRAAEVPRTTAGSIDVRSEISGGLLEVARSPVLRTVAGYEAARNFFGMFIGALYVLFGIRELGLSPLLVGITVGIGGISNLFGTFVVQHVTRRFGFATTIAVAAVGGCVGPVLIGLAPASAVGGFTVLVAAQALDLIHPLWEVNALTLRQVVTPDRLLGRVNATLHVIGRGVVPFGALAGGWLADAVGLRPTLLIAAAGFLAGAVWVLVSLRATTGRESAVLFDAHP